MLDRTKAPEFKVPDKFTLPQGEAKSLKNSIPIFIVSTGSQPAIRVEFIFRAGVWYEPVKGVSFFTSKMLTGGTTKYNANQIEEKLAGFGAFLDINPGSDHVNLTLYCLQKHLNEILPLIKEVITDPVFPEEEFENQRNILIQQIKVNKEKTGYLASTGFKENLFGKDHPYGRSLSEDDAKKVQVDDLKQYYETAFSSFNCEIFISGNPGDYYNIFNSHFGQEAWGRKHGLQKNPSVQFSPGEKEIVKKGSLQTSIRFGFPLFTISHPDYFAVSVVNELLGGYFGSRLMKNIREDKGYTYGIHSSVVSMLQEGYWFTGTDVKKENANDTISEIYKEIEKVKTTLVSEEELSTVKNILRGAFLNSINTPFAIADKLKTVHYHNLNHEFYNRYFDFIEQVSPEQVKETSEKYFNNSNYLIILAG